MDEMLEKLRYPVGRFQTPETASVSDISRWIGTLEMLPTQLIEAVDGLDEDQLDTPYRPDGWSVRQVVHHVADSHMNSYIRFKWALTEDNPTIKAYNEKLWAETPDGGSAPIELSLMLVEALHERWVWFLRELKPSHFERTFVHPDTKRTLVLKNVLALYDWHSRHHLAHITSLRERNGW